ncbi:DUF5325 family protein [Fictibacillus sp. Mic-4]|uniref:DUF5325 family protein n=1 Tax=Fictibacillus TaxID=1329200 RepID=UPI000420F342|nr:DUF5325 family protein [Fictibacillus gelatini]
MKFTNVIFFLIAMLAALSIASIGVALAEKSWLIGILAVIGVIVFMGLGFTLKKRLREAGKI